jgi:hypothetical protein
VSFSETLYFFPNSDKNRYIHSERFQNRKIKFA